MLNDFSEATEEQKNKTVQTAIKILLFLRTDVPNKLRLAEKRREALKTLVQKGSVPKQDHRVEFLFKTSTDIFGWLGDRALEFNVANPHDLCTANDLLDVLTLAKNKMTNKMKELQKEKRSESTSVSSSVKQ